MLAVLLNKCCNDLLVPYYTLLSAFVVSQVQLENGHEHKHPSMPDSITETQETGGIYQDLKAPVNATIHLAMSRGLKKILGKQIGLLGLHPQNLSLRPPKIFESNLQLKQGCLEVRVEQIRIGIDGSSPPWTRKSFTYNLGSHKIY